jgi:hypothetical protein
MRYKDITIAADDFDFQDQAAIAKIIDDYVGELGLSDYDKLTGFNWRLDVRMRMDNYDT